MSLLRRIRVLGATALLAGASVALNALGADRAPAPQVRATVHSHGAGALGLKNSKRGRAVVSAQDMAPGQVRRGRVAIRVGARAGVDLAVDRIDLTPGPAGGSLAGALSLRIKEIGGGTGRYRTVYDGPLMALAPTRLGRWGARERHRFRVRVELVSDPGSQDSLQGAQTSFRLLWQARPVGR